MRNKLQAERKKHSAQLMASRDETKAVEQAIHASLLVDTLTTLNLES